MSEKNPDGKFQCTVCDYGHGEGNGKSRQAVIKHYKKTHNEEEEDVIIFSDDTEYEEPEIDDSRPPPTFHEPSEDGPTEEPQHVWLIMEDDEEDEPTTAARLRGPIRDFLKGLRIHSQSAGDAPMSAAELRAERQVHHRLLTWAWMGIDRLYTLWGRMMLGSREYEFAKSPGENAILATASLDSLAYHGIDVNRVLNPDVVLAITVGTFYGPETVKLATRGKASGRSLLSRIPLIGRLFRRKRPKRREVRRVEDDAEGNHGA